VTFAYAAPGDTNLDGMVDIADVAYFLTAGTFGSGVAAALVALGTCRRRPGRDGRCFVGA